MSSGGWKSCYMLGDGNRSNKTKFNKHNAISIELQFKHCNGVGRLTMGTYTPRSHRRKCHECNEGNTCVQRGAEELLYAGRLTIVTHDARFAHVPHSTYKRRGDGNTGNAKTRSGEAVVQKCTAETKVKKIKVYRSNKTKLSLVNRWYGHNCWVIGTRAPRD